ncbi:MAG: high frequency lysogenization protein HflD [Spongiibacteraceae bacterium]
MNSIEAQTLALAGILQATYLVDQIARTGQADSAAMNSILHSLFVFESDDPTVVYAGTHHLQLGLRVLRDVLSGHNRDAYQGAVRYGLGILILQKLLAKAPEAQNTIRTRLQHAEKKLEFFTQDINEIAPSLASIYQDTISRFKYRIQITGSLQQLQNSANADKIRALLLAAIRSAWLWRRVGGRRWQFVLNRNAMRRCADALIRG